MCPPVVGAAEVGFQVLGAGGGDVAQVADVDQARAGRRCRPVDHLHGPVGVRGAGSRQAGSDTSSIPAAQSRLRRQASSSLTNAGVQSRRAGHLSLHVCLMEIDHGTAGGCLNQ